MAGTTTATVLTRAILSEGTKSVAAGMNPMDLRRGINVAVQAVVADLKLRATNISTTEEIAQVRTPLNCGEALNSHFQPLYCTATCRFSQVAPCENKVGIQFEVLD